MNADSRKAARDSFARQRSRLLFLGKPVSGNATPDTPRDPSAKAATSRDVVRKGLIGFVASGAL